MPVIGLGVYEIPEGREVRAGRRVAPRGRVPAYRYGSGYGNEAGVERAPGESDSAGQVFITTKFAPSRSDPEAELERSLERLAVEQGTTSAQPPRRAEACMAGMDRPSTVG